MRVCSGPGCLRAIADDRRFCDECKPTTQSIDSTIKTHTTGDREKYASLYTGTRWQRLRKEVIKKFPICARCDLRISEIADHIVPAGVAIVQAQLSGVYPLDRNAGFFLMSNLQGLCRQCHGLKTNEDKTHTGEWPDVVAIDKALPKKRWSF